MNPSKKGFIVAESILDMSCSDFASALAAKRSVPGGGGAAAFCGALAAALGSMVGNFTVGKKRYAAYEEDVQALIAAADDARGRLLALADEDSRAFGPLARAFSLAADDPRRPAALEEGALEALQPPLAMMREIVAVIDILEEMNLKGSALLRSDVGCGAAFAEAALLAASMNVYVNTGILADRARAASVEAECEGLLAQRDRAMALAQAVADDLRHGRG